MAFGPDTLVGESGPARVEVGGGGCVSGGGLRGLFDLVDGELSTPGDEVHDVGVDAHSPEDLHLGV